MQVSLYLVLEQRALNYNFDRGQRALASCLGGGDLDGDDFNLILDVSYFLMHPFMSDRPAAGSTASELLPAWRIPVIAHQEDRSHMWHQRCRGLRFRLCGSHLPFDYHKMNCELRLRRTLSVKSLRITSGFLT